MKVLLITNLYPNKADPNWGIFNFQQFESLSKLCDITAIVPISLRKLHEWKKIVKGSLALENNSSIYHPVLIYLPKLRALHGFLYFCSIFPRARRVIKKEKPDVIIGTWVFPDGYAAIKLGKRYNIPVYLKVHGSDIHSVEGNYRKKLSAWTLRSCVKVISVSNSLSATMQSEFGVPEKNICVLPNGVFKDKFSPLAKKDALYGIDIKDTHQKNIVFVGNLKPVKNIMMLVEAFDKLYKDSNDSIALHILGSGVMHSEIDSYIKKHNLINNVYLHGKVSHEKIPFWMNYADVFVLPSKKEGMPNVVLEALSCGTPVVASNIEATREIIDDGINGYLFDLSNLEDFVKKLKLGLELKQAPEFDHKHDMIISWKENAERLFQIIA